MLKLRTTEDSDYLSTKPSDCKKYPFPSIMIRYFLKIRDDMTGGPSIVFTRKAVANKTFSRKSNNLCSSIIGLNASQQYL